MIPQTQQILNFKVCDDSFPPLAALSIQCLYSKVDGFTHLTFLCLPLLPPFLTIFVFELLAAILIRQAHASCFIFSNQE